jgi:short-subunit dehydrogenase
MTEQGTWGRGWALVTGASGGLGEDMARLLAARGFPLILTARSGDRLERLAAELADAHGVQVRVLPEDLARPGAARGLAERVEALGTPVEVLVNNAGFGQRGPYPELDGEDELEMMRLNMEAVTVLTRRILPRMLQRGYGRILNVASTAAFLPGPLMTVYYATKAYVLSYSEALAEELRESGVSVTCLCPGPTRTGFHRRASLGHSRLLALGLMESEEVARAGVDGLFREKGLVVPGLYNKLTTLLPRILPRKIVPKIVRLVQAARDPGGNE